MFAELYTTLSHATLSLPAIEVVILIAIVAICLVFRLSRIGLVAAYLFTYRWGWMFFDDQPQGTLMAYLIFGCLVGILTVVGMLTTEG